MADVMAGIARSRHHGGLSLCAPDNHDQRMSYCASAARNDSTTALVVWLVPQRYKIDYLDSIARVDDNDVERTSQTFDADGVVHIHPRESR